MIVGKKEDHAKVVNLILIVKILQKMKEICWHALNQQRKTVIGMKQTMHVIK